MTERFANSGVMHRMADRRFFGCPAMGLPLPALAFVFETHRLWKAGHLSDLESGRRLTEHVALFMTEKHLTVAR